MKEAPVIEIKNVKKYYELGEVTVKALDGVSLKIFEGDFVVIVGPSGSGKSTLMHILGTLDHPTTGDVLIDNENLKTLDEWELAMLRRKKIGFIFQSFNLIPTLNALENVVIPTEPLPGNKEYFEDRGIELLKSVKLGDRLLHKPDELSGGQRQRVSIARSLINNPEIIFADEPTGNLDSITGKQIVDLMYDLNQKENKTFVLVTHDPSLLDYATKRVFILDGKITKVEESKGKKRT
ncbi:MAG: ABC transporter ATP-binding protein [archaeon]|nr:ABC transporter ATP-binding protein [archaeon]